MTVKEHIRSVADQRAAILKGLAASDDADSAFTEAEAFRESSIEQLAAAKAQVAELEKVHAIKEKDFNSLKGKGGGLYKLVGKADEKVAERERAMVTAAQVQPCSAFDTNLLHVFLTREELACTCRRTNTMPRAGTRDVLCTLDGQVQGVNPECLQGRHVRWYASLLACGDARTEPQRAGHACARREECSEHGSTPACINIINSIMPSPDLTPSLL